MTCRGQDGGRGAIKLQAGRERWGQVVPGALFNRTAPLSQLRGPHLGLGHSQRKAACQPLATWRIQPRSSNQRNRALANHPLSHTTHLPGGRSPIPAWPAAERLWRPRLRRPRAGLAPPRPVARARPLPFPRAGRPIEPESALIDRAASLPGCRVSKRHLAGQLLIGCCCAGQGRNGSQQWHTNDFAEHDSTFS